MNECRLMMRRKRRDYLLYRDQVLAGRLAGAGGEESRMKRLDGVDRGPRGDLGA